MTLIKDLTLIGMLLRLMMNKHVKRPCRRHKYTSDLLNHMSVYKVTPYSPRQHEDDGKVKHHSLKDTLHNLSWQMKNAKSRGRGHT